eukprot:g19772.t1
MGLERHSIVTPSLVVAFLYIFRAGDAQYDSCNGTIADIGDGRCDPELNIPTSCFDATLVAEFPDCNGDWFLIGDGSCDAENNVATCGWDGGDCCPCDCSGEACGLSEFDCFDPDAGNELYDCQATPPAALPCSTDVQRTWSVENSAQAQALAAAVNCSGGTFEVEWRGRVVVDEAINVVGGTVLTVAGAEPGAVIDGNGSTRLFTVVDATLDVTGVNISSGASVLGGAIAGFGATLTLSRTILIGNRAARDAGAVLISDGSSLSCVDVSFVDNNADVDGGAVHVSGSSVVSCGGSWLNNTAGRYGGALAVFDNSTVSWGQESIFARNLAGIDGGAVSVFGSSLWWNSSTVFLKNKGHFGGAALIAGPSASMSWTGQTKSDFIGNVSEAGGAIAVVDSSHVLCTENTTSSFIGNVAVSRAGALWLGGGARADFGGNALFDGNSATGVPDDFESGFGGAVVVDSGSSVSWHRGLHFRGNSAEKVAGALYVSLSRISWSGSTQFVANKAGLSAGALFMWNGSYVELAGDTKFTSNEAGADGGAVGSPGLDSEYNFLSSTLIINGSTTFVNNTSRANGGALALSEGVSVSILAANVSFIDNSATTAGGAVHVSGSGVGPVFTGVDFMSNSAQVGGAVSTVGSGKLKGFADVESTNPTTYERCRFIENRATATGGAIESASGQDHIFNSVFEGNKAGAGGALRLAGTTSVENCSFVDNISDDGEGGGISNIGSISRMTNISFSGNTFYCQPDMFLGYESGDPYEAVCSGCQTSCDECLFEEPDRVPVCKGAIDHSTSSGGTVTLQTLSIDPGYWRATASSEDILACYNADACLGGISGTIDYCLEGYEGPYCSVCSDGYTAQLGFTCDKCPDKTVGIVLVVVVAVVAVIVGVAVVVYVMPGGVLCTGRGGSLGRLFRNIPLQSVKIIIVTWQIISQFAAVANVTFPHVYQRFLNALDVFNFDISWILLTGCVVDVDFHDRLLVSTITPLIALLFIAGTYTAATNINRGATDDLEVIRNKHVSMVLLLTFLVYSSVSAALFKTFACEHLDNGNIYLRADYHIRCDSPQHEAVEVYAGIMIVLYSAGIPAFYSYLLFRDRDVLKNEADRENISHIATTSDLWKPYKPSVFYYEVIECGRRLVLAGVVVFIEPNTSAQVAVTLMMAFVFVVISEALAPYASRWDAWLSRVGHAVVFMTMYLALLLKGKKPGSGTRTGRDTKDDTDEDTDKEEGQWGGGDCDGIAQVGRAFDVQGTPHDTWEAAFNTVIEELKEAGHLTVLSKRRKLTTDKRRHYPCEIVCRHSGKARARRAPAEGQKRRNCTTKESYCGHNDDPRGAAPAAQAHILPLEVVDERYADIRKWTAAGVGHTDIFKLLEMDDDGKVLDKAGKRKASSSARVFLAIRKIQDELYSTPEDGADFLAKLEAEPGMFVRRTFDNLGRIVDVFWATVDQQDKMSRFGGCVQMDTTVFTNSKNVMKNCASSFPDMEERAQMLRLFRSAAYAASPEAFARYRVDLERIVKDKKCEEYMGVLLQEKMKWAFSCRPTVLTMGMVATQRTEGMFGVAKNSGIHKKLSLCGLWDKLQLLWSHEAKAEVGGSQSYDVEVICAGAADDDGRPGLLGEGVLRRKLEAARFDLSLFEEAPPETDLEKDFMRGPEAESTDDSSVWARTSLEALLDIIGEIPVHVAAAVRYKLAPARPGHDVVLGPDGFHLCSCLKLLRHGLVCRHYFAVLVRFLDSKFKGVLLDHRFNGNSVHARWRQSLNGNDEPWTVSRVLQEAGHGEGWDGCDQGADDNFWGPTFDDDGGGDGVHPSERAIKAAAARSATDERRVFASMMAKNKENVSEILRTVSHVKAMEIQAALDKWVRFQLLEATGQNNAKNPAQVKKAERPKKSKSGGKQQEGGDGNGAPPTQTGSVKPVACFDATLVAEFPDCNGDWFLIGDGSCDAENNVATCGWDGGDCCPCDCYGEACSLSEFVCFDPDAGNELYDCQATPPASLPCTADVQQTWIVENSAQAQALAAAVNCSGGAFEVEWRGRVVVDEAINIVGGTVLTVTGTEPGAVIDGNRSTRLFTVVDATLHVTGVNISSGASVLGGAIGAFGATLTLSRTSLVGNRAARDAGAIFISDGSSLSCVDVSFVDNNADVDGGAVHVSGSSVVSCGGSWLNNTAGRYGGALAVFDNSTVSWGQESIFARNSAEVDGGAVSVFGSSLSWTASTVFLRNKARFGGAALIVGPSASMSWTKQAQGHFIENAAEAGGAIAIVDSSHVLCAENTTSSFIGNVAVSRAGALWLGGGARADFDGNALFDSNSATGDPDEFESGFGGAAVVDSGSSVSWHRGLHFRGNSAEKVAGALYVSLSRISWSGSTQFVANKAGLSAGALFMWNGSHVEWTGDTKFTSNEAGADGGAVGSPGFDLEYNFLSSTLVINGSTTFVNNTSRANGGALALSEGVSVSILAANVSFIDNSATTAGGAVHVSGSGVGPVFTGIDFLSNSAQVGGAVSTVGSGKLEGFADVESPNPTTYERCRFIENRATATGGAIESASGQDYIFNSVFEGNKAGAGGALRLAGTTSVENCSFVDNISDDGEGGGISNIGSISRMTNISFSGNTFYCQPDMFLGYESGDPYEAVCSGCQTSCDECLFEEPDRVPVCKGAIDHSTSSGGTVTLQTLSIDPGYWRATASSEDILACYNADACLGGISGTIDYCLEGYEGPYCSVCSDGYTAQLGFTCDKCSDNTVGIVLVVVVAVVAVIVGVAVVVKFAAVANVTFPHVYQRFLNALDVFNFDITWILSAGCVVDVDFHDRLLVSTITPLIALLFIAGTYTVATNINRGAIENLQVIWNKLVSMVLLLTFLVYSSVSAALFKTFACEHLDNGTIYLRADYRIKCDSSKHKAFKAYAGIMIVLYTAGIPAFYCYLLFRDRDVLTKNEADRENISHIATTSDLWKTYKPSVFYYEVIECGRRILLAGVVVFIEPNTSAQVAVTLMMAFVFVVISEALAPYASRWDAWLSRVGHAVVFVTMYLALLLKVDVSDERVGSQRVFEAILVGAHSCMIAVVVVETVVVACSLTSSATHFKFRRLLRIGPVWSVRSAEHTIGTLTRPTR